MGSDLTPEELAKLQAVMRGRVAEHPSNAFLANVLAALDELSRRRAEETRCAERSF